MRTIDARVIGGVLLVGFGVLFYLQTLGLLQSFGSELLWGILFGVAGFLFLYVFLRDREQWWAIFPAMPLLGVAGILLLEAIAPALAGVIGATLLLGLISLGFWIVYLNRREFWWAIIPGGVMAATAVVVLLANVVPGVESAALLLLGIGLTFLVLYFLPEERGRQPWAIIPGGILIMIAALMGIAFGTMARFFWPLVFIVAGLVLVLRSRRSTPSV